MRKGRYDRGKGALIKHLTFRRIKFLASSYTSQPFWFETGLVISVIYQHLAKKGE